MARPKADQQVATECNDLDSIASNLITSLNKKATSSNAILAGDLAEQTWGLPIPHLAFQYAVGGVNVMPCQRLYQVTGLHKSFKSTLLKEIGAWYMEAGGFYIDIDNEGKTSATMFDAMTWWRQETLSKGRHVFKATESVEEWQNQITETIKVARKLGLREKGRRIPWFVVLDSLTGKSTEAAQEALQKEGHAESRGYPLQAAATANFIKAMNMMGTTLSMGVVRHLSQDISAAPSYGGPKMKAGGAVAVNFQYSVALRLARGDSPVRAASHPGAPRPDLPVEGYTLYIVAEQSCLGPVIDRKIEVDVLWQYVPQEDGSVRQAMFYDWDGALGLMLWQLKYDEKSRAYDSDRKRLDETLLFTQPKGKRIKCDELGLDGVSFTEFGKAIRTTPEVQAKVARFLNIARYPSFQDVDIEPFKGKDDE